MNDKRLIIDRFEGEFAVIEYGDIMFNLPRELLPLTAKEGDVLILQLSIDVSATDERQTHIQRLMDKLWE
jgi:hypothetical protein